MTFQSDAMKKSYALVRIRLKQELKKCTKSEVNLFNQMYPNGPSDDQLDWAFKQIENTLATRKDGD